MKTKLCLLNIALTAQDINGAPSTMKQNIYPFSIRVENNKLTIQNIVKREI